MKAFGIIVLILGIAVIALGVAILVQFMGVQEQMRIAQSAGGLAGLQKAFEALRASLRWATDAFSLLIVNLFLTGVALVVSGIAFARASVQRK